MSRLFPLLVLYLAICWAMTGAAQIVDLSTLGISAAEQKIRHALDDDTRLEFIECPLEDVVQFLADQHGVPIHIDRKALDAEKIGADLPITADIRGIPLRSALNHILNDIDLAWQIRDDMLVITSLPGARARPSTAVYHVGDLIALGQTADPLADIVEATLNDDGYSDAIQVRAYQQLLVVRALEVRQTDVERLLAKMREAVRLPWWQERSALVAQHRLERSPSLGAPIQPWDVGKGTRYALAGSMDFDGDGNSDREALRALIQATGGIVDAELKENGAMEGRMTLHTHYLVLGGRTGDESPKWMQAFAELLATSTKEGVDRVSAEKVFRRLQVYQQQARAAAKPKPPKPKSAPAGKDPFGGGAPANAGPFGGGASPPDPVGGGQDPFGGGSTEKKDTSKSR
jgi:hypothetical protein